jgi:hypothetical protein
MGKLMGREWKKLTLEERKPFQDKSEADKNRYRKAMEFFLTTHGAQESKASHIYYSRKYGINLPRFSSTSPSVSAVPKKKRGRERGAGRREKKAGIRLRSEHVEEEEGVEGVEGVPQEVPQEVPTAAKTSNETAYMKYIRHVRPLLKENFPHETPIQIGHRLGKFWSLLHIGKEGGGKKKKEKKSGDGGGSKKKTTTLAAAKRAFEKSMIGHRATTSYVRCSKGVDKKKTDKKTDSIQSSTKQTKKTDKILPLLYYM